MYERKRITEKTARNTNKNRKRKKTYSKIFLHDDTNRNNKKCLNIQTKVLFLNFIFN